MLYYFILSNWWTKNDNSVATFLLSPIHMQGVFINFIARAQHSPKTFKTNIQSINKYKKNQMTSSDVLHMFRNTEPNWFETVNGFYPFITN